MLSSAKTNVANFSALPRKRTAAGIPSSFPSTGVDDFTAAIGEVVAGIERAPLLEFRGKRQRGGLRALTR